MGPYVYVALWHHCHGEEVAVLLSDRKDLTKEEVERRLSDLNWGNFDPASDMEWISLDGPITPIELSDQSEEERVMGRDESKPAVDKLLSDAMARGDAWRAMSDKLLARQRQELSDLNDRHMRELEKAYRTWELEKAYRTYWKRESDDA